MPAGRSKSGLYAMKGPKDEAAVDRYLASPYGGAFAVGSDDADVWGGLPGTEVGEAYGVGGLGLVGTGRGGGGTGEGTIGLGSTGLVGKGGGGGSGYGRGSGGDGGSRRRSAPGSYSKQLQSSVLTVGTVDDNADLEGLREGAAALGATPGIARHRRRRCGRWRRRSSATCRRRAGLNVALVIDTTGSMGDELEYLKVELRDIARRCRGVIRA